MAIEDDVATLVDEVAALETRLTTLETSVTALEKRLEVLEVIGPTPNTGSAAVLSAVETLQTTLIGKLDEASAEASTERILIQSIGTTLVALHAALAPLLAKADRVNPGPNR